MAQRNLAVIGGGPKAAALAAKAYCLRQLGVPIRVSIFEKDEIGAAWDGRHGYTDGNQRLCTPAERDLGFPYDTGMTRSVAVQMQADFSWAAYLSTRRGPDYSDWVSRGRKPPFHRDFADYLRYAVERSNADVFHGRVTGLRIEDGLWTIDQVDRDSRNRIATKGFHGTVVTGPGPAARHVRRIDDPRVFTGETFWGKLGAVRRLLRRARNQIVIGGGGTAAAVAAWLVRNSGEALRIVLLHDQATLFTRTANFFENRIFDNEDAWQAMSEKDRQTFVQRLNRGVVWESVSEILADASQLALETGRATAIEHGEHPSGARPDLVVRFSSHSKGTTSHTADIVVDAACRIGPSCTSRCSRRRSGPVTCR